jgi:intracellular septation protein
LPFAPARLALKFLFDFFPVILFFVAFKAVDIYVATAVAIAATLAQIGYLLARRRRVSPMQWLSLVIIGVFGGATLLLHDETFIKWKPTVLYWAGAVSFIVALAFGNNFVKAIMSEGGLELPQPVWTRLAIAWSGFFFLQGAINLWVAFHYSTATWVNFKLFGGMGLTVAFVLVQALWLTRHVAPAPAPAKPDTRES